MCISALLSATPAAAASGWIATCSEPKGPGLQFGRMVDLAGVVIQTDRDGFIPADDSFTGVFPVFVYQGGNEMLTVWGNTRPEGIPSAIIPETKPSKEIVVAASADRVSTLAVYPGETRLTTLYPAIGAAYATRQKYFEFAQTRLAVTATFAMTCQFDAL